MGWPAIAMAVSAIVSALYGAYSQNKAAKQAQGQMNALGSSPIPPDYWWLSEHGPRLWDYMEQYGQNLIDRPQGLGEMRNVLRGNAASQSAAAFQGTQRANRNRLAAAGLSQAGGTANRQAYTAGQDYSRDLMSAYTNIDLADYQAKQEERQQGANLLMSLSNRSPVYSQIVAQNYWNAMNNAQSQFNMNSNAAANSIGSVGSTLLEYFLNQQNMNNYNYNGPYYSNYGSTGFINSPSNSNYDYAVGNPYNW